MISRVERKSSVQTLWIDPVMGLHQIECLKSFVELGTDVYCYSYGEIENLPKNIKLEDANEIIDERYVFKDNLNSYATFSDWFRIKLLYDKGGWWVDSDVLCVKPFDIDWPYVFATEIVRQANDERIHICNCVIKMPRRSDMGKSLLKRIEKKLSSHDSTEIGWTEIGAKYIYTEITDRDMFDYVVDPKVFCPFEYANFQKIFTDPNFELDEITYGVHLWNKMWEWIQKEPMSEMTRGSFFERITKK